MKLTLHKVRLKFIDNFDQKLVVEIFLLNMQTSADDNVLIYWSVMKLLLFLMCFYHFLMFY